MRWLRASLEIEYTSRNWWCQATFKGDASNAHSSVIEQDHRQRCVPLLRKIRECLVISSQETFETTGKSGLPPGQQGWVKAQAAAMLLERNSTTAWNYLVAFSY